MIIRAMDAYYDYNIGPWRLKRLSDGRWEVSGPGGKTVIRDNERQAAAFANMYPTGKIGDW